MERETEKNSTELKAESREERKGVVGGELQGYEERETRQRSGAH